MANRKSYTVTKVGGPRPDIAGKMRTPGEEILLTDVEAENELRRGTVELTDEVGEEKSAKGRAKASE